MVSLDNVRTGWHLFSRLPWFLRHPLTADVAERVLRRRLQTRTAMFLHNARVIYQESRHPARTLLLQAGCTYADLERMVRSSGLEETLQTLFRRGVYLTVGEFKGREATERSGRALNVQPALLLNPVSAFHIPAGSSGSRGASTLAPIDLAFISGCAVDTCLWLAARGGGEWVKALWETPRGGGLFRLLKYASFGRPPRGWFSQIQTTRQELQARYRWSMHAVGWASRLAGRRLPAPAYAPLDDPLPLARWLAGIVRSGETVHLFTFPSSAVRLAGAAQDAGIELAGVRFLLGGEPVTAARLQAIRATGADGVSRYGTIETGPIGYGCLAPDAPDDVHLLDDLHALIQVAPQEARPGLPPGALLVTSLHARAPFLFLNVSMGDQAVVDRRRCGCPAEEIGWTTHLRGIRSFEKLTTGGMTLLDTDVIRVLEDVLPSRFGGAPTDYQLLEEDGADGQPRLRLLVHPLVGPVDSRHLADAFLAALGATAGSHLTRWYRLGWFTVERQIPRVTGSGKILHLVGRPPA